MRYFLILIFLIGHTANSLAQHNIEAIVIDSLNETPLPGVNIIDINDSQNGTISDEQGKFNLSIKKLPTQIRLSFIGYESLAISLVDSIQNKYIFQLKPATTPLPEITVSSKRKIDTVYKQPYSIVDYEFLDDFIILLAYKNAIEKYSLIILNEEDEVIHELSLKDKRPAGLHKSCTDGIHLITTVNAYKIEVDSIALALNKAISLEKFEDLLAPCALSTQNFIYFSRYYFQGQALRYFAIPKNNIADSTLQFPLIEDVRNIDLLIWEMGARMPHSGDVWSDNVADNLEQLRDQKYALAGFNKILFPKLYAPIIEKDSSMCIFNHIESELQFFTEKGDSLYQVPIEYHRQKKWRKKIFFDTKDGRAYTSFHTKWGEDIREINLETGKLGIPITLDRAFPEKLKARNGYLYFLFRKDTGRDWNKKLHKMRVD